MKQIKRGLSLILFFWAVLAAAQTYPAKPVRIIVAVGPGGGDDFVARQVAAKMGELLGQQFIVENRPGAGGMIGQSLVAKSAPDGYTLLLAGGSMAGAKYVNANMGYQLARDFTPISLLEISPFALVVRVVTTILKRPWSSSRPPSSGLSRVSTANHILIVSRTCRARAIASSGPLPPATAALAASTQSPVAPQAISES